MNLSKSRYCRGLQCKKMLWLEKNKPEEMIELNNDSVLEQGNVVHEVAKYLFKEHINIEYTDNLNEMIDNTAVTIDSYKDVVITEATFNYNNNFCSVDILKKNNNSYEICEVKSSTEVKDIYINDAAYQYYVLTSLGLNVTKCSIIVLNNKYVRHGDLDLDKLFIKYDITDDVINLQDIVKENIENINEYMKQEKEPTDDIDIKCFNPYSCPFFKYCTKHIPSDNVFNIANMHTSKKIKLYKNGIYTYKDLLTSDINDNHKQQIEYELYDKEDYIDKDKIKEFLNTLSYPLYFLDFETYQMPIPLYDNVSPYEKIPFQYSLHYIEKENGNLKHTEYLAEAGIDPRRKLAERLIYDIPKDTCVLAYNMSFEKSVIKKLSLMYPDLSEHLMNIYNNMQDLMIPFRNREYYNKDMHGSYSIKYVLPALFPDDESLNYHNLDLIHNGGEAMNAFTTLEEKSIEEQKYVRESLLKYCELDTYAMVKIYEKLIEKVNETNTKDD